MEVVDELGEQAAKVLLAEDDDAIEQFAANGADQTLHGAILPGALEGGADGRCADRPDRRADLFGEGGVAAV
jgi:hypothetical protein